MRFAMRAIENLELMLVREELGVSKFSRRLKKIYQLTMKRACRVFETMPQRNWFLSRLTVLQLWDRILRPALWKSLKLLVDARQKKVLLAEAGKDFVDFLFSLLTLPVGSIINLLSPRSMTGCIAKLYQSVEKLNETYLLPNRDKETLLHPKIVPTDGVSPLLLGSAPAGSQAEATYYGCGRCSATVTTARTTMCPFCRSGMIIEMSFVAPTVSNNAESAEGESGGYVKGVVTYMVTDDLVVTPMSAISSISLINKYGMKKDAVELEEKMVYVSMKEGIALLKASLGSKTALSDVFLGKPASAKSPSSCA